MTFHPSARWIWDDSDPGKIEQYDLLARREFRVGPALLQKIRTSGDARLRITAESYYQVWLNDRVLGHGPAKSPEGERFVDTFDLSPSDLLREGDNRLGVLVHALGVGTMNACPDGAGLIFQIELPDGSVIPSDPATLVQRDPQRLKRTVRRWMMPCIEDVDANAEVAWASSPCSGGDEKSSHGELAVRPSSIQSHGLEARATSWRPATLVDHRARLLPRPVPLPSRTPISPNRVIACDDVQFPNFSCTFRIKPYLVNEQEQGRCNLFQQPALIVTDLISECDQEIELVPTAGQVIWFFHDKKLVHSSGWGRWPGDPTPKTLRLHQGANRLVGVHVERDHFQYANLAAFAPHPVYPENPFGKGGFQVLLADERPLLSDDERELSPAAQELMAHGPYPDMDPQHTLTDANPQDLVANARRTSGAGVPPASPTASLFTLPPSRCPGSAVRLIVDLGAIHNGWLAFSAFGKAGDTLIFSFFESLAPGAPLRIVWPGPLNNAIRYRLRDGWQHFESFFAYGVRYIGVHHQGDAPVEIRDLRILSAHCGNLPAASIRTGDVALDAIHALCEQTLYAATDDTLTDCPTYEAVNWNFDNRLGTLADFTTFRNLPVLRNTIEHYTRDPLYPGLVRSHAPSTWENRIPVFSFHWILLCRDYHWHTADRAFVGRVFPQVARGLEEALGMIDPALGLLRWRDPHDGWHLADWAQGRDDKHDVVSAEQALLLGALEAGEYLAEEMLKTDKLKSEILQTCITHWQAARASLCSAIDRHLWSSDRDAYADSLHADGTLSPVSSQVSNAALALHGAGSPEWHTRFHRRLQTRDPALLPFGSPMGLFYLLEFLDRRDDVETIFKLIRDKWTPMLAAGDRTAWEHFPEYSGDPDFPTRSRCHPFATWILKYYVKYLLGLTATAPGQHEFRFDPRPPADLDSFQGALPVTDGWIRVSWRRKDDGRLDAAIEAPPGITLTRSFQPVPSVVLTS
ncbi:alpha-L-rhamnosidase [Opitutaceae bacterium TAV5]|nr:alpha-L-rhamnosidase [Opitutaceae bacterium TAV5]